MFTIKYHETRLNTDAEWWHFLPENKSWIDTFESQMISEGLMLSCTNEVSEDGLNFVRTAIYPSKEASIEVMLNVPYPDYQSNRVNYNVEHSHDFYSEEING